jgi:hypothetical protein
MTAAAGLRCRRIILIVRHADDSEAFRLPETSYALYKVFFLIATGVIQTERRHAVPQGEASPAQ